MKKLKAFLLILLGIALGILGAVGFYYLSIGETEWQLYVEEKLILNIVFILTSISGISVLAMPIISRIQASAAKFDKATEDVNTTYQNDKEMLDFLSEYREEMSSMMEEFKALRGDVEGYISPVKHTAENIEKIARIGFGNTAELVRNGYAHEIAKVGKENEQSKENT